jgi:hypothetical protein
MKSINSTQRKALSVLPVIITVGAFALCLPLGKGNRKDFVGSVYSGTGYRCRFALSSAWQRVRETRDADGMSVEDSFVSSSENPIWHWIILHLYPKTVSAGNARSISLNVIQTSVDPFSYYIVAGYPQPLYSRHQRFSSSRRLMIDGCPATLTTISDMLSGRLARRSSLVVYVPNHSIIYDVEIVAETPDFNQADDEMRVIISSFRVDRVTAPMIHRK